MAKTTETLPYQLIEDLRYDIEVLKKKLSEPDDKINSLVLEMEALKESLKELNDIFKVALKETKEEETMKNQLQTVLKQNETIATGMLAVADKIDELVKSRPAIPQFQRPPPIVQQQPRMTFHEPPRAEEPLPPPPLPGKKKMLGSIFG